MKFLLTLAAAGMFSLVSAPDVMAQGVQFRGGSRGLSYGTPYRYNNSYGNRLNRYNNFGNRNYGNRGWGNHDYYGGNYGRRNNYQNYYRTYPYSGYNRWYNSRPGISIGNGRTGFYYSF